MPQAQGDFVPAAGFLPNHRVELECSESDAELFEEAQGMELPLSQGSTISTASTTSNMDQQSDLDCLMEAVRCERNELNNGAQEMARNLPQYPTVSHMENMAVRLNAVTPTKPRDEELDPLTPTANMKLLMSAVSPELRNREKEQRKSEKQKPAQQVTVEANNNYIPPAPKGIKRKSSHSEEVEDEDTQATGRKEKSLGLLCQRFMGRYPEFPNPGDRIEICLDAVAKELGVERRRIYDIVNVLESVEIMSRLAKNKYVWHGRTNLLTTLAKLKALGFEEGFDETIEKIKDFEMSKDLPNLKKSPVADENTRYDNMMKESVRKDRSLGIMSQRFLMLFLVAKNQAINLDLAAKILVGDPNIDKTESGKFKTQIRRLYDIANILTSLDLIKKVHVTEVRGRKPAFKYNGPTVEDKAQAIPLTGYATAGPIKTATTATRNSLLNGTQSQKMVGMLNNKTSLRRTMSQQVIRKKDTSQQEINQKFSRHASFEMMCEIAEGERKRLYYESQSEKAVSQSQPTSPLKGKVIGPRCAVRSSDVAKAKQNLFSTVASDSPQSSPTVGRREIKRYVVFNNSAASFQNSAADSESSQGSNSSEAIALSPSEAIAVQTQGDQFHLKVHLSHPNLPEKQPTLLKLSKAQIQSVLESMSQNSGSTVSSSQYKVSPAPGLTTTQVQTQDGSQVQLLHVNRKEVTAQPESQGLLVSPPDVSRVRNRKRPLEEEEDTSAEECYFNAKRPKKDVESNPSVASQSPPLDTEVAAINGSHPLNKVVNATKPRPSPLRALHLDPEFQSSRQGEVSPTVLQSPVLSLSQPNSMAAPTQVPGGLIKKAGLLRSKSASPSTFMFGGRGVGSLQTEASSVPQQCTFINTPTGLVSPLNGCAVTPVSINTPGITAQVIATDGYQITPTSSIRPSRNIVPSSGAILNLVPHLQSNTAQGESPAQNVTTIPVSALNTGGARILARHLSADQISALRARQAQPQQQQPKVISVPIGGTTNIQTQTQYYRVNSQGILQTPTEQQQFATQIISPSMNNTTPSTQLAASKSFFQSTPSGSLIRITTHQISPSDMVQQQQQTSAFRIVNNQTFTPITETVTARRLTLSAEQTP